VALGAAQHRHLLEALEGDDGDLGGAAPDGRAGGVDGFLGSRIRLGDESVEFFLGGFPAQAESGARGVVGNEASADDHNLAPEGQSIAAVDVQEIVDRFRTVEVHAGGGVCAPRHAH
jgi:hypothetical protein